MTTLTLIRPNLHRVDSAGRQMLFHVPSSSLFELDGAARDVLALFDEHATLDAASLAERLGGRHDALAVRETVDELRQLQVLNTNVWSVCSWWCSLSSCPCSSPSA